MPRILKVLEIKKLSNLIPGCCGRSEETTSWCLIFGVTFFSVVYNFSRFFEYEMKWIIVQHEVYDTETNLTWVENITKPEVLVINGTK